MKHEIKIEYRDEGASQYRMITVDGAEGKEIPPYLKKWLLRDWLDEFIR